ncbi:MAG: 3-hydroxyisobutyrate dehydrogenase [Dongiaceae bacterium]
MRIAFIGLGNMGAPMAANLIKVGFRVRGYDAVVGARERAATFMTVSETSFDAVADADAVVTMLPNGEVAVQVWLEIVAKLPAGTVAIDCSTIDLASARSIHELCSRFGLLPVDAPVSGGVGGAAAGTLTFMCGGADEALDAAMPILSAMGKRIVRCGTAGAGQAAKICNNMVLGVSMIAVCEAFALADRLGLDRQAMFEVVSTSSGSCWSINTYCPVPGVGPKSPADNDYKPGFAAALMLKDLRLARDAAASVNAHAPLGAHAAEIYERFVTEGNGDKDFSAVIQALGAATPKEPQ